MIEVCAEGSTNQATAWLSRYRRQKPTFACVLSFTETGLISGISAAGQTPEDRCRTAAADGAFLACHSRHRALVSLPKLSAGISPAVITRAILRALPASCHLLSTGLPVALLAPHIALPQVQAKSLQTGNAMSLRAAQSLFEAGQQWGHQLAKTGHYLVIGECVVGGTTTAQAVLTALGYDAANRMSSSHIHGNHAQKQQLVKTGLTAWQRQQRLTHTALPSHAQRGNQPAITSQAIASPIEIVAAVGDPMQLVVAGMALTASRTGGVLLAGGAQMLAVYALLKALLQEPNQASSATGNIHQVVVGTTRWVIADSSADTVAIAAQIKAPYIASQLNFRQSPYMQLRAYEQGFVKEGVGAGGCAIAAHLYAGYSNDQLRHAIEQEMPFAY